MEPRTRPTPNLIWDGCDIGDKNKLDSFEQSSNVVFGKFQILKIKHHYPNLITETYEMANSPKTEENKNDP